MAEYRLHCFAQSGNAYKTALMLEMAGADLSCAGYMFYEDEFPIDWAVEYPAVTAWRERIKALPGWKHPHALMPGNPIPAGS